MRRCAALALIAAAVCGASDGARAQRCNLEGARVTCDDGRVGMMNGDSIVWPDGTRSSRSPHPSVFLHNKPSISIGQGVFVGSPSGVGVVPLDDPNSVNKQNCAIVNDIPYCH
ncbi:hypothetical protein [Terrarubrum flagellatum]|uniref:hypothetical protein n=1 Tax=Terrirubrum flagellatum TaxID=2895980 RepID=UPI00314534F8